jgi:hypothetical protein
MFVEWYDKQNSLKGQREMQIFVVAVGALFLGFAYLRIGRYIAYSVQDMVLDFDKSGHRKVTWHAKPPNWKPTTEEEKNTALGTTLLWLPTGLIVLIVYSIAWSDALGRLFLRHGRKLFE